MQKQIILRILVTSTLFVTSLLSASLSSTEITNMVSEIKKERKGISLLKLEVTANPFILNMPVQKEVVEGKEKVSVLSDVEIIYSLKAILNKAAFIDKKWYKQGDTIGNYTVGYVSSSSVELKNLNNSKTLSLEKKKKKKNFIKLNRGYR